MVTLAPWSAADFWLLERCNSPEMTAYLGGPETAEQLVSRHARYVENAFPGQMCVIITAEGNAAGSIGYWEHAEAGETVWETGWAILPEQQGKGIATAAIAEVAKAAAAEGTHRSLHAYPGVDNAASNALCRKAGFTFQAAREFEYPKGHWMRCNDWSLEL
ncbi:GNAT family protein [Streptomyces sp. SID13031]|uniref:GNAT family N-acetyltransferase n=1 Tax=Streptomyces sp. SID13031 TaxID=2706046 RepID=UPI0013CAA3C1|nr:GNAT family protein [Streptomyces sp. SID13031]NEA34545.1 GNAT family N-acetyltransferase [Streptomyces sp. SID13031]